MKHLFLFAITISAILFGAFPALADILPPPPPPPPPRPSPNPGESTLVFTGLAATVGVFLAGAYLARRPWRRNTIQS